jgi:DNA replication protein DnaC
MNRVVDVKAELTQSLKYLHLPTVRQCYEEVARQAERESLSYERYLHELVQRECEERQENRITKMLRESQLPLDKSLEAFDSKRLPSKAARQMRSLLDGSFLERTENVLVFGNPGSGKTHMLQAVSQELVRRGHRMLFITCEMLVQELLIAKRDLKLSRLIKRYSRYEGMIIDDLGYIRQTREEMEVVFTLLAERYERGSVLLTSNLPFSKWEGIFKDPMTTAAAIDRLVHHSVIVELNVPSYRLEHFLFYCRPLKASLNQAFALSGVMDGRASVMAWSSVSLVRALAARSSCLSFAQAFSIGLRSGE